MIIIIQHYDAEKDWIQEGKKSFTVEWVVLNLPFFWFPFIIIFNQNQIF